LAGHVELVALEVDDPVQLLVAAAAMAHGHPAVDVAAAVLLEVFDQRLLGLLAGDLLEGRHRHEAASRAGRLVLLDRHLSHTPSKRPWIDCLAFRVTMAFFQSGLRPSTRVLPRLRRRTLPRTLMVFTATTSIFWSENRSSMACLISILLASGRQRK